MILFYLNREEDESGVSGTGIVAEGVIFKNGKVAIAWCSASGIASVTVYNTINDVEAIHGHKGKTKIVYGSPNEKPIGERRVF